MTTSPMPTQIVGMSGTVAVAAGYVSTVAVKSDGTVTSFGLGVGRFSTVPSIVSVAGGYEFVVVVKGDGTAWASGINNVGQLGNGTISNSLSTTPVQVSGLSSVVATAAGYRHALAVESGGTVWTWGLNGYGQLGNGTTTNSTTPVQVSGLSGVVAIAAGEYHTVALKSDGTVWTWGQNSYSQLGNGTTTNSTTPVQVSGLSSVVAIAAGEAHTVALKSDGTVWTWGFNGNGELGNGTTTNSTTPVQVNGLSGVVAIAATGYDTIAVKGDGTLQICGENYYGELGNGTTDNNAHTVPVQAGGGIAASTVPSRPLLALGGYHSLAVQPDGTVDAWGDNSCGQLGDGTTNSETNAQPVPGLSNVVTVAAGSYHSLALRSDGTVWAWGYNLAGQLGDGTQTERSSAVQVLGPEGTGFLTNVVAVAAGSYYSLALCGDGTVWGWGYNGDDELGLGSSAAFNSGVPVQVGSSFAAVKSIFAGNRHAMALCSDGTVWAWGINTLGQLGNGTTASAASPGQVSGFSAGVPIVDLANGGSASTSDHSLVVAADGSVWAWGNDDHGQLGDGASGSYRTAPYHVAGAASNGVANVSTGSGFSLALTSKGTLLGWGRNTEGELANGTTAQQSTPVAVGSALPAGTRFAAASGGNTQVASLTSAGAVLLWGAQNLSAPVSGPNTVGDGVPDSWKQTYGIPTLDPSVGGSQPDGDGLTLLQKYQQGVPPGTKDNPAIQLVVTVIAQ